MYFVNQLSLTGRYFSTSCEKDDLIGNQNQLTMNQL